MLIPEAGWAALVERGVSVRLVGPDSVEVGDPETGIRVHASIVRSSSPLSPSDVRGLVERRPGARGTLLLVVPSASPAALDMAAVRGISVLAVSPGPKPQVSGHLLFGARFLSLREPAEGDRGLPGVPSRPGYGTFAVGRVLLTGPPLTQVAMAELAGVSQPRVSQVLKQLSGLGLVAREGAWVANDWDALADWWLSAYPGPGGLRTFWYGLDGAVDQARSLIAMLGADGVACAVSGDVAADQLAPWRRPGRAVVYARPSADGPALDLERGGLTPVGADDATLELVVPADPGVWRLRGGPDAPGLLPVVEPMQVLWDLSRAPGSDTDQAVGELRRTMRAAALRAKASA